MIRAFARQLRWELRKLWRRPRTYVGFAAALAFELLLFSLLRIPAVREQILASIWSLQRYFGIEDGFSGLTTAVEVTGQTMLFIGAVALTLVASDLIAKEAEDGTLRMIFCRPVSRTSVLLQKLAACAVYTVALTVFVAATALALGLLFEGPGRLVVFSARESIMGAHDFWPGLVRYASAVGLLAASIFTVPLLALALSCLPLKPTTVAILAILVLLGDWAVQAHPTFAPVSPYTLMTRLSSWRQVFNDAIPWLRLERNYTDLLRIDATLVAMAWWAFRWRPLTPP